MFLKTPKFGMQQKAHTFISGLPNLNSLHTLARDNESNYLNKNRFFFDKNNDF